MAKRINDTLQKKVRAFVFDSKLPETKWDLAINAVVYCYNRTEPRKKTEGG